MTINDIAEQINAYRHAAPVCPPPMHELSDTALSRSILAVRDFNRGKQGVQVTIMPDTHRRWIDQMGDREYTYWAARGLPPYLIGDFQVGWDGQRYTFPWFYRGILTAVKRRRDDDLNPDQEPKYISLTGSRYLAPYNIDTVLGRCPHTVLIVEDEKSTIAAARLGFVAVGCPANAWKEWWSELLLNTREIVIVADRDEPGQESAEKVREMLGRGQVYTPLLYMLDGNPAKDLHDELMAAVLPSARVALAQRLGTPESRRKLVI